jgi:acetoin:2,6-dichlorophenolindophenol oxidoreductase subunit alpha
VAFASAQLLDPAPGALSTERLLDLYRTCLLIRLTEERLAELLLAKEIHCPTHLYTGQEAIAAGVCASLGEQDYVFGAHRSHGHYLAKGGDLRSMMAEIYGKTAGCARGRGGSMHLVAPEVGIVGTVPIVGATIPLAVGAGLAAHLRKDGLVSVAFFGDGAVEEGTFHESMNLAASIKLPVIFVCENNLYSSHLHLLERRAKDNIVDSAAAHGMPGEVVDGNDLMQVCESAERAVSRARAGDGPTFLEYRTYRWRGHVGPSLDLDVGVKRKDELSEWRDRDPITRTQSLLVERGISAHRFADIEEELRGEIEASIEFARSTPYPDPEEVTWYVYKESRQ